MVLTFYILQKCTFTVEASRVDETAVTLKLLQQLINFILHVVCVLDLKSQDTFHTAHQQDEEYKTI